MKKKEIGVERRMESRQEFLLQQDWCSLGVRANYWTGSPWRALGMLFHADAEA